MDEVFWQFLKVERVYLYKTLRAMPGVKISMLFPTWFHFHCLQSQFPLPLFTTRLLLFSILTSMSATLLIHQAKKKTQWFNSQNPPLINVLLLPHHITYLLLFTSLKNPNLYQKWWRTHRIKTSIHQLTWLFWKSLSRLNCSNPHWGYWVFYSLQFVLFLGLFTWITEMLLQGVCFDFRMG